MILQNILIWFVIIPLIMLAGLAVCKKMTQIRTVMVVCSTALLILSGWLCMDFLAQRAAGNTAEISFP